MSQQKDNKSIVGNLKNAQSIEEICNLITGLTTQELKQLKELLNNIPFRTEKTAEVLSDAFRITAKKNPKLAKQLSPLIEQGVKSSIEQNPKEYVGILAPILGPTIRKYIANALSDFTESTERVIAQSLSIKRVKWWLESKRTGRTISDIYFYNTLKYKINHLFIIDRETGLLLLHADSEGDKDRSADVISGMLTAINDFVKDSFDIESKEHIGSIKIGDLTLRVFSGSRVILAAVHHGNLPIDVVEDLRSLLDQFHFENRTKLRSYNGDIEIFSSFQQELDDSLLFEYKDKYKKENKSSIKYYLLLLILLAALGYFLYNKFLFNKNFQELRNKINNEAGLMITDYGKDKKLINFFGLKDPYAKTPLDIIRKNSFFNKYNFNLNFKSYESLEPEFIFKKLIKNIQIPKEVTVTTNSDDNLIVTGKAYYAWKENLVLELKKHNLENRLLFRDFTLKDKEDFDNILMKLNNFKINFMVSSTKYSAESNDEMNMFANELFKLFKLSNILGYNVKINIYAYAGSTGSVKVNKRISNERLDLIKSKLISKNIDISKINLVPWAGNDETCENVSFLCESDIPGLAAKVIKVEK